jgi:branched-chain amino acid transport system ATP-binding protein
VGTEPNNSTGQSRETTHEKQSLISAYDIVSGYGELQVLFGVDIEVYDEELVMIFGPNGSGKSTFIKTLTGIQPAWSGTIRIQGEEITNIPAEDRASYGLGYVPQTANVFPNLSVRENLTIGSLAGNGAQRREEVVDLFPELGNRLGQRASTLSGGQRQMLAMGRALMGDPDILLVDEPSAGLAPNLVDRAFDHIRTIVEAGTAVLMVEQNIRAGLEIADRGYALDGGETRFTGSADELLESDQIHDLYMGT